MIHIHPAHLFQQSPKTHFTFIDGLPGYLTPVGGFPFYEFSNLIRWYVPVLV